MTRKEALRREAMRERDKARLRKDWHAAQDAYERARRLDLPTAQKLRNALSKARSRVLRADKLHRWAERRLRRIKPLNPELTIIGNHSSRGGVRPRIIVLHITVSHNRPGLSDVRAIAEFFGRVDASSHIINDREGHDCRCVRDVDKAWTQAAYNPQALSIEQVEMEVKSRQRWLKESKPQLNNTAAWVAYWSHKYGIPLQHSTKHGVCQHRDLGAAGGGHIDCSPDFPLDYVLAEARAIRKLKYGH